MLGSLDDIREVNLIIQLNLKYSNGWINWKNRCTKFLPKQDQDCREIQSPQGQDLERRDTGNTRLHIFPGGIEDCQDWSLHQQVLD